MDTKEHTELGNSLRFTGIEGNPYLRTDEQGVLHVTLQRCQENGLPEPMRLEMTAGEIIAMAADFFTDRDWNMKLDLPSCHSFETAESFAMEASSNSLGDYLIEQPVTDKEENALLNAYNNLASPDVSRQNIDLIYKIDGSNYIPFSATLNDYFKQLMFVLRVKDYGEMLNRNQTHFTPWSVRVYTLGHHLALKYAHFAAELKQLMADADYQGVSIESQTIIQTLRSQKENLSSEYLQDLFYRYQALAYCIELFVFHYYSDHFAAGHMSMVGDLRVLLTERFGTWGSILANNLHNELNRVGVYTKRPYDPTPTPTEAPTSARGDGDFNSCINHFNKAACIAGMQCSVLDIEYVITGEKVPSQRQYGGLEHLPDVDSNYRQLQPLLVLGNDTKIYHRKHLNQIKTLSPSDYAQLKIAPAQCGYRELKGKWDAFALVAKLRLFPYIFDGKVQPLTALELQRIEEEEKALNPERDPIPTPPCTPTQRPLEKTPNWRTPTSEQQIYEGLGKHGLLNSAANPGIKVEEKEELTQAFITNKC
ncbi:type IV secretion protein Dot [Legionella jamestowniensis]|uniref:Type IV secretion protein Dot n=1 Tax=Legionella jamestowniensis TaxID=455 RepID=A0ABX2XXU8_9GAMM|nr:type IV secretion protein Dot [Legionella jamestowniensis]OCH99472.1 type IV secretion protein Dot [Legionella jamestowniensis]